MTDWKAPDDTVFIGVDLTNDFMPPNGALQVAGGNDIVPLVNHLSAHFRHVLWTKEEHDARHDFFASSHPGKKPLDTVETPYGVQLLWPDHCVTGTHGAEFHADLTVNKDDMILVKGTDKHIHAYSAVLMDDRATIIRYPDGKTLPEKLRDKSLTRAVVTGLAYDFCVGFTAIDLAKAGFDVILVRDATRGIGLDIGEGRSTEHAMTDMLREAGVILTDAASLPRHLAAPAPRPA